MAQRGRGFILASISWPQHKQTENTERSTECKHTAMWGVVRDVPVLWRTYVQNSKTECVLYIKNRRNKRLHRRFETSVRAIVLLYNRAALDDTHPSVLCGSPRPVPLVPVSNTRSFECFTMRFFLGFKCWHVFHLQKPHERDILAGCFKVKTVLHRRRLTFWCLDLLK